MLRSIWLLLLLWGLAACAPPEPLRVGFLGGVSGRVADLGIAGRNGAQLAVEMRNAAGGVRGRKLELIVEDDQQDAERARQAMTRLLGQQVVAVIGPMTSVVAMAVVPQANQSRLLMISPTVTTNLLTGKDDHFLRVTSATRDYAGISADHHYGKKGLRRMVALLDTRNRAYTEDWLAVYRDAFVARGGSVIAAIEFASSDDLHFSELARRALTDKPDGILLLANSVDAAMLLQHIRKIDPHVVVAGSEWAATERLVELAGKAAEGFMTAQFFDRRSAAPAYVAFRQAYQQRFGADPGFAGTNGFDAANVLFAALDKQTEGQSLKTLLVGQKFVGSQSEIVFDAFGDVARPTFITTVSGGEFVAAR